MALPSHLREFDDTDKTRQLIFDNCLDALSVMNKHVPGMKQDADELVARTNEVRKAKPGQKDFVDLDRYGSARAKVASEQRNAGKQKQEQNIQL